MTGVILPRRVAGGGIKLNDFTLECVCEVASTWTPVDVTAQSKLLLIRDGIPPQEPGTGLFVYFPLYIGFTVKWVSANEFDLYGWDGWVETPDDIHSGPIYLGRFDTDTRYTFTLEFYQEGGVSWAGYVPTRATDFYARFYASGVELVPQSEDYTNCPLGITTEDFQRKFEYGTAWTVGGLNDGAGTCDFEGQVWDWRIWDNVDGSENYVEEWRNWINESIHQTLRDGDQYPDTLFFYVPMGRDSSELDTGVRHFLSVVDRTVPVLQASEKVSTEGGYFTLDQKVGTLYLGSDLSQGLLEGHRDVQAPFNWYPAGHWDGTTVVGPPIVAAQIFSMEGWFYYKSRRESYDDRGDVTLMEFYWTNGAGTKTHRIQIYLSSSGGYDPSPGSGQLITDDTLRFRVSNFLTAGGEVVHDDQLLTANLVPNTAFHLAIGTDQAGGSPNDWQVNYYDATQGAIEDIFTLAGSPLKMPLNDIVDCFVAVGGVQPDNELTASPDIYFTELRGYQILRSQATITAERGTDVDASPLDAWYSDANNLFVIYGWREDLAFGVSPVRSKTTTAIPVIFGAGNWHGLSQPYYVYLEPVTPEQSVFTEVSVNEGRFLTCYDQAGGAQYAGDFLDEIAKYGYGDDYVTGAYAHPYGDDLGNQFMRPISTSIPTQSQLDNATGEEGLQAWTIYNDPLNQALHTVLDEAQPIVDEFITVLDPKYEPGNPAGDSVNALFRMTPAEVPVAGTMTVSFYYRVRNPGEFWELEVVLGDESQLDSIPVIGTYDQSTEPFGWKREDINIVLVTPKDEYSWGQMQLGFKATAETGRIQKRPLAIDLGRSIDKGFVPVEEKSLEEQFFHEWLWEENANYYVTTPLMDTNESTEDYPSQVRMVYRLETFGTDPEFVENDYFIKMTVAATQPGFSVRPFIYQFDPDGNENKDVMATPYIDWKTIPPGQANQPIVATELEWALERPTFDDLLSEWTGLSIGWDIKLEPSSQGQYSTFTLTPYNPEAGREWTVKTIVAALYDPALGEFLPTMGLGTDSSNPANKLTIAQLQARIDANDPIATNVSDDKAQVKTWVDQGNGLYFSGFDIFLNDELRSKYRASLPDNGDTEAVVVVTVQCSGYHDLVASPTIPNSGCIFGVAFGAWRGISGFYDGNLHPGPENPDNGNPALQQEDPTPNSVLDPTSPAASTKWKDAIVITWDSVEFATGYRVKRDTTGGRTWDNLPASQTQFVHDVRDANNPTASRNYLISAIKGNEYSSPGAAAVGGTTDPNGESWFDTVGQDEGNTEDGTAGSDNTYTLTKEKTLFLQPYSATVADSGGTVNADIVSNVLVNAYIGSFANSGWAKQTRTIKAYYSKKEFDKLTDEDWRYLYLRIYSAHLSGKPGAGPPSQPNRDERDEGVWVNSIEVDVVQGYIAGVDYIALEGPGQTSIDVAWAQIVTPPPNAGVSARYGDSEDVFLGTKERLYAVSASDPSQATDVGKLQPAASYGQANIPAEWNFCSVGDEYVIATNYEDDIQMRVRVGAPPVWQDFEDLIPPFWDTSTTPVTPDFSAGPATATLITAERPKARFATVVRNFLVLANINSTGLAGGLGGPQWIWWSDIMEPEGYGPRAFNRRSLDVASTAWEQQSLSDAFPVYQTPGEITGLVGGDNGIVFKANSMHALLYTGTLDVFRTEVITRSIGCNLPGSIVNADGRVLFWDGGSFQMTTGLAPPVRIGAEVISRWLGDPLASPHALKTKEVEPYAIEAQRMSSAYDKQTGIVAWLYQHNAGTEYQNTRMLLYNVHEDRWGFVLDENLQGSVLFDRSNPDSGSRPNLRNIEGAFTGRSTVGWFRFSGNEIYEAVLETKAQQLDSERVCQVRGIMPLFTAGGAIERATTVWPPVDITVYSSDDPRFLTNVRREEKKRVVADEGQYIPFDIGGRWFRVRMVVPEDPGNIVQSFQGFMLDYEIRGTE